jgi:hypothetical protein
MKLEKNVFAKSLKFSPISSYFLCRSNLKTCRRRFQDEKDKNLRKFVVEALQGQLESCLVPPPQIIINTDIIFQCIFNFLLELTLTMKTSFEGLFESFKSWRKLTNYCLHSEADLDCGICMFLDQNFFLSMKTSCK